MGLLEQQYADGLLAPQTANPKMLAQALKARQQPRTQLTGQGLLDTAAIGLSPVPVIGDALGLAADFSRYMNDPSSRTPLNFGLTALGALPFVPPAAAIFAGPLAKTAKLDQKAIAEGMEKAGRSRDDIWKETGWFKGPEGKWKFEISDKYDLVDTPSGLKEVGAYWKSGENAHLSSLKKENGSPKITQWMAMSHDDFFNAYPDIKATGLIGGAKQGEGSYLPNSDTVEMSFRDLANAANPQKAEHLNKTMSINLHELQHAIQGREGFAKGGSPRMMGDAMGEYRNLNERFNAAFDKYLTSADDIVKNNALQEMNFLKPKIAEFDKFKGITSPEEAYTKLAGEAEARAVQSRMNMNPQQRQATPPWQSYDVPWEQLIIK